MLLQLLLQYLPNLAALPRHPPVSAPGTACWAPHGLQPGPWMGAATSAGTTGLGAAAA